MPMFEYVCKDCNHITESLCKIHERQVPVACELCAGVSFFKISAPAGLKGLPNDEGGYRHISGKTGKWKSGIGTGDKSTKAYQKQMDDSVSTFYHPSSTVGKSKQELKAFNTEKLKNNII
jgi:putative FmdB family regulatory protein